MLSHDEVVHGKKALLDKMPGDDWQRFANLRCLYTYMFSYPGKKLLFMGNEFAQWHEWNHDTELDWELLDARNHAQISALIADLNRIYAGQSALNNHDFEQQGFEWIDCHDRDRTTL